MSAPNTPTMNIFSGAGVIIYRFWTAKDTFPSDRHGMPVVIEWLSQLPMLSWLREYYLKRLIRSIYGARLAVEARLDEHGHCTGFTVVVMVPHDAPDNFWARASSNIGRTAEVYFGYASHSTTHQSLAKEAADPYARPPA